MGRAIRGLCLLLACAGPAAAPVAAQEVYHDNVVVILDASGSMKEMMRGTWVRKMDAAKAALKQVVARVPASTHVGLLVFSGMGFDDEWLYPLGARDDQALLAAIDRPQPDGGTPLGVYIKKGADRLVEERGRQFGYGSYRLLVVTDGEASDPALVERYTPEVMARGITLDVIGVDMAQDHTLATRVHSYRSADDPASLVRAIAEVFAEIDAGSSDAAGEEAFQALAPIPAETALAMVEALSRSGDQPIGEPSAPSQEAQPAGRPASASAAPAPAEVVEAALGVGLIVVLLAGFVALAVLLFMIALVFKGGGRRG